MPPRIPLFLGLVIAALGAPPAHAQTPAELAGAYTAGPLQVRYRIESWGPDCGPRPRNGSEGRGGSVQVGARGDHLTFAGAVRGATDGCWSDRPGMSRRSATASGGRWNVACTTPSGAVEQERGRYAFTASEDRIAFRETTTWDWQLRESRCTATREGTRSFRRVVSETAQATADTPAPEPEASNCTPGAAARLVLRPGESTIEPGARICFAARVVDAAGCRLPDARPRIRLGPLPAGRQGRMEGNCFVAGGSAATGEGSFRIIASGAGFSADASITVQAEDLSGLRARADATPRASGSGSAQGAAASGVAAEVGGGPNVALLAALLALLAAGAFLLIRRQRSTPSMPPGSMPPGSMPPGSMRPGSVPPGSMRAGSVPPGSVPPAGAPVSAPPAPRPVSSPPSSVPPPPAAEPRICPVCRRSYGANETHCPHDGAALVGYAEYMALSRDAPSGAERTCPTCGTRYASSVAFCGKDGTPLADD